MEIFDANVGLLIQLVKEEIKKTAFQYQQRHHRPASYIRTSQNVYSKVQTQNANLKPAKLKL